MENYTKPILIELVWTLNIITPTENNRIENSIVLYTKQYIFSCSFLEGYEMICLKSLYAALLNKGR